MKVFGLSGSVRVRSSNSALLRTFAALAPAQWELDLYESLGDVPMFSPDLDGEGDIPPPAVADLRRRMRAAEAIVVSTPEYAHGVPGALKNALDWIVSSGELEGKPTVLLAASSSGAPWARTGLLPTLEVMGARVIVNESIVLTRRHIDADEKISDPVITDKLKATIVALSAWRPE